MWLALTPRESEMMDESTLAEALLMIIVAMLAVTVLGAVMRRA